MESKENKEKSLRDLMQELVEQNKKESDKKKNKKFRFSFFDDLKIRFFGKGQLKKNYVIVQYINENRAVSFMKVPIEDNALMIKDSPYMAMSDHILLYDKKPMIILPSWNTEPFSPRENMAEAERNKTLNLGYRLLLNKMKVEVQNTKKKMNWIMIVGGIALIIGLIYLISKGGSMPKLV